MAALPSRRASIEALDERLFDVLVVGGGINGAVSVAALRARGAEVALIDKGDFASFVSQHSSNLAWGGIKYLETYEFGLVRKLCRSRNELLRAYPSAVREVRFFTALPRGFRHSRWFLYLGALLYWAIGSFFTRRPRLLSNDDIARDEPSINTKNTEGGLEYSDAHFVDSDAHFVFRFIRDAMEGGAVVANYLESRGAQFDGTLWTTEVYDHLTGRSHTVRSKVVVNACGPHVETHNARSELTTRHRHVFSKGVHLIVPQVTHPGRVLTFFASDGRLFFAIPMGPCTSIGTTDTRVDELPPFVTTDDRQFILDNINERLSLPSPLTPSDVIAERCGVRPLVVAASGDKTDVKDDWTALSRKHELEVDAERPTVCIFGGKLTDCINVGEEVAAAVEGLGIALRDPQERWYGEAGDDDDRRRFMSRAADLGLDHNSDGTRNEAPARRLWRRYGPRAEAMLDAIAEDPRQAEVVLPHTDLMRVEAAHAARHECVAKLEDYLRRRTLIEQTVPREQLVNMPELRELCIVLFGDEADERLAEYVGTADPTTATRQLGVSNLSADHEDIARGA